MLYALYTVFSQYSKVEKRNKKITRKGNYIYGIILYQIQASVDPCRSNPCCSGVHCILEGLRVFS